MWPEFDVSFAVDFYDWGSLGEAQVVDVGGSQGAFAMALAKKYPLVHVTVQDMLSVVSSIDASDLATNVSFMAHDLFDTQTVDADVFFFRWIFHNWSDPYCIQILNAQIPAMRYGARLIIQEFLLPEKGDIAMWKEMDIRYVETPANPTSAVRSVVSYDILDHLTWEWPLSLTVGRERLATGRLCLNLLIAGSCLKKSFSLKAPPWEC